MRYIKSRVELTCGECVEADVDGEERYFCELGYRAHEVMFCDTEYHDDYGASYTERHSTRNPVKQC